ncbi:uncharacterized protein LOC133313019 isoform X2 [Gastrolobium bilobum]|uniref:uncharacterized protein LOC133313019 isoform X2 n=1 Tax=Gastrolobium bilobum TaxID=150636 RepID=UPI002AB2BD36|nr:uncharacterized protein LOC133313019 isoform X2 [Gastrolobium bilobum]
MSDSIRNLSASLPHQEEEGCCLVQDHVLIHSELEMISYQELQVCNSLGRYIRINLLFLKPGLDDLNSLPCLIFLVCLRDTFIPEGRKLRDPRRLYAAGRMYHIMERKFCRQSFAKALSKSSKECEISFKNESVKFQALYEKFSKEKATSLQALEDIVSKFEEEKEKLFMRYEQLRKKERVIISEQEKTCNDKIAQLEESLKKKKQVRMLQEPLVASGHIWIMHEMWHFF